MPLNTLRKNSASFVFGGTLALALLGASVGVASMQDQPDRESDREKASQVGTYEPQAVFQNSPHSATLTERLAPLQQEAQQAAQEGDQQRAIEIQGRMQTIQNEVVQEFLSDVEAAIPNVAAEAGMKIVALDVVWVDPELGEPKDISNDLVAELNGNAPANDEGPRFPPSE